MGLQLIYFPIIKLTDCKGWTTINSFPPNDWEVKVDDEYYLSSSWVEKDKWNSKTLKKLNQMKQQL